MEKKFLTIRETAKTGLLSEPCLRRMVKEGKCPGVYVNSRFYVNIGLLLEQLDQESLQNVKA